MGCRAQRVCLPFPEGKPSGGEARDTLSVHALVKGRCLAQGTQQQGLSWDCQYRRWLASAWPVPPSRDQSSDGGLGSNVQTPSGSKECCY